MIITISGLPGSGKSTVAGILKQELGWEYVYAGAIFRKTAEERGMTLEEFGAYCEKHPDVDKELDARQLEIAKKSENLILEGRMAGHLAKQNGLKAVTVWLDAPIEIRVKRIMRRESGDFEARLSEAKKREASEAARYKKYYGVDLYDRKVYDLVLDVSEISAEQAAEAILAKVKNIKLKKHT
jgi:predicted cytidylate kinase